MHSVPGAVCAKNRKNCFLPKLTEIEAVRALTDYDQAIALNPQYADAYCNRGLVRIRQRDEAGAQRDFQQCLTLNPALKASLERLIAEAKQQMLTRGQAR